MASLSSFIKARNATSAKKGQNINNVGMLKTEPQKASA